MARQRSMASAQAGQKAKTKTKEVKDGHSSRSTGSVTLGDVARLAGVSPITVSRVLNYPELVTPETFEHVQRMIDRTGYLPNMLAGGLASRRSRLVAAIVPSIVNSVFVDAVQALTDRLWEAGYQVLLGLSGYPPSREDALLAAVLSRRPDAIYLTGINHSPQTRQRLLAAKIPVVETWDLTPTPIDMLVGFSHEKVGQAVAEYFLGKGYRRFGMIWADDARAVVRRRGFLATLAKAGIHDVQTMTIPAPSTLGLGREGMARLLDSAFKLDAVFCSSDLLASGALEEARSRSLPVPRQLAIMGFGGLDFTQYTFPPLSSVHIDRALIGRQAAEIILARIEGNMQSGQVIDVGFQIIERATT